MTEQNVMANVSSEEAKAGEIEIDSSNVSKGGWDLSVEADAEVAIPEAEVVVGEAPEEKEEVAKETVLPEMIANGNETKGDAGIVEEQDEVKVDPNVIQEVKDEHVKDEVKIEQNEVEIKGETKTEQDVETKDDEIKLEPLVETPKVVDQVVKDEPTTNGAKVEESVVGSTEDNGAVDTSEEPSVVNNEAVDTELPLEVAETELTAQTEEPVEEGVPVGLAEDRLPEDDLPEEESLEDELPANNDLPVENDENDLPENDLPENDSPEDDLPVDTPIADSLLVEPSLLDEESMLVQQDSLLDEQTPAPVPGAVNNFFDNPVQEEIAPLSDDEIAVEEDSEPELSPESPPSDSDDSYIDSEVSDDDSVKADGNLDLDEDDAEIIAGPITSANEITNEIAPGLPIGYVVPPNAPIECVGEVIALVEQSMIIKANTSGEFRVLKDESIFCFQDRTVIGPLCETFGRLQQPVYRVKFNTPEEFERFKHTKGQSVYYVVPDSYFVYTDSIKNLRGTDASNCHDEEIPEDEQEYSDDERELAAKQARKKKRQNKAGVEDNRKRSSNPLNEPAKRFQPYNYADPAQVPGYHLPQVSKPHPYQAYQPLHAGAPQSFQQLRQGQPPAQQLPHPQQLGVPQHYPQHPLQHPQQVPQQQAPRQQHPHQLQHQQQGLQQQGLQQQGHPQGHPQLPNMPPQQFNQQYQQYPPTYQPVNEFNPVQGSPYGVPFNQVQHGYYPNHQNPPPNQFGYQNYPPQAHMGQGNAQGSPQGYPSAHPSSIASGNGQITNQTGPIGQPTDPYQQEQLQKLQQLISNQMKQSPPGN